MNFLAHARGGLLAFALCLVALPQASADSLFTLDGIYDPSNDGYTHEFNFPLILDNGTAAGTTSLKVGVDYTTNMNPTGNLFVYFEMPLDLKDMTWGTGTHDGYAEGGDVVGGEIAMNQNTGSEKIKFLWGGEAVEVKLSMRGAGKSQSEIDDAIADGTITGHELKSDGGGAVIGAATSLDYIIKNFPNTTPLQYWGDVDKTAADSDSNSPELKKDSDGNDIYETVDPLLSKWPFHQSWELEIEGAFTNDDLPNLLTSPEFFGADFGDGDPSKSNFLLHASPIKAGEKFDVVPEGDPEDFPPVEIPPTVPEPSSLALFAALGLLSLGARRRR